MTSLSLSTQHNEQHDEQHKDQHNEHNEHNKHKDHHSDDDQKRVHTTMMDHSQKLVKRPKTEAQVDARNFEEHHGDKHGRYVSAKRVGRVMGLC